jgi:Na+/proline symporter
MLTGFDFAVIGVFFIFFIGLGLFFRRFARDSSDYFRGGGQMSWWLVGATGFMGSFSAWTFTGGAGVAYDAGIVVMVIYGANIIGFITNAIGPAARFRQMRVITAMEAVRLRLGAGNEQFFTWINLPLQVLTGGILLYGLAIFCAPVFELNMVLTVVLCGCVVTFVAATGGAWAVAASDFLQALMLLPITIVVAVLCLVRIGGLKEMVDRVPAETFDLTASHASGFGVLWMIAIVLEKVVGFNALHVGGPRYLPVRDGREARKAALLGAGLFIIGAFWWFIPPLAAKAQQLDLKAMFPDLSVPAEGAYVAMAQQVLPNGLLGLMVTGMLAATMSSMNESLNRNAGIFVRSFYRVILRPKAGERELVWAGRLTTLALGGFVVLIALFYSSLKDVGVFSLMFSFSALIVMPTCVPMLLCLVTRRTVDWVAWFTVLAGFVTGLAMLLLPSFSQTSEMAAALGLAEALAFMKSHFYATTMLVNLVVCSACYLGVSALCGHRLSEKRQREIEAFLVTMKTPLAPEEKGSAREAGAQSVRIGRMALCYGGFVALLLLIPNAWTGRLAILFCAAFIGGAGWALIKTGKSHKPTSPPEFKP